MRKMLEVSVLALVLALPIGEAMAEVMAEEEESAGGEDFPGAIHLGAVGAVNISNVDFRDVENPFSTRVGLGAGLQVKWDLGERFSLQGELLYVQRGMTAEALDLDRVDPDDEENGAVAAERQTYNFHLMQVPLFLRWNQPLGENFTLGALAGPTASLFLSRTRTNREGTFETTREGLRPLTFGMAAGLALDRMLGAGAATLEMRYDRDLSSFLEVQEGVEAGAVHWAASLMVGYRYSL